MEDDLIQSINDTSLLKHKLPVNPGRPLGFLRAKVQNRAIVLRTLVDSGNLFADLMSEDLAKKLKLPITGKVKTVGTASTNGKVTILGKA